MPKKTLRTIEIDWMPDKSEKSPLHSQIVKYFIDKISKGDWLIGDQVPPQRVLAKAFGINRSTLVNATSELTSLGLLKSNFGHGTIIANNTWSLLVSSAPPNWRGYINSSIHSPNIPLIQTINKLEFQKGITRLGTGELSPNLLTSDLMEKALISTAKHPFSYIGPLGLPELRRALSNYLPKYGINVPPSSILIVSGSLQALHLISIGMLKPNSTIFTEKFSYLKSLKIFQSAKMNLQGIPMDDSGIIPTMIDTSNLSKGASLLYTIPTFHNPTGIVMPTKRRIELLEWCTMNQIPIIEDDAYRELWFEDAPPLPLKSYDENGIVLYMGSISKSLAPGFRLGWLIGPEAVIEHLADIKMQVDYGANSISQWALTEWIESGMYERHLKSLRVTLRERRDIDLKTLDTYFKNIATWNFPTGGFYIWLKLKDDVNITRLFNLAIARNILINPGSIYGYGDNQYIRISYSYAEIPELIEGLKHLATMIKALSKSGL